MSSLSLPDLKSSLKCSVKGRHPFSVWQLGLLAANSLGINNDGDAAFGGWR
jgi:hypothetical protein